MSQLVNYPLNVINHDFERNESRFSGVRIYMGNVKEWSRGKLTKYSFLSICLMFLSKKYMSDVKIDVIYAYLYKLNFTANIKANQTPVTNCMKFTTKFLMVPAGMKALQSS